MKNNATNQTIKFGLVLGTISLVSTFVLALAYQVTKPAIDRQLNNEEGLALRLILPEVDNFYKRSSDGVEYFEAFKDGNLAGYCVKVTGAGYGGFIRGIVGIDLNGAVKGVRILEHYETPGLGSKINEIKPNEKDPWFLRQFIGKDAEAVAVGKNIDAITGATISSRAVTDAIRETINRFPAKDK